MVSLVVGRMCTRSSGMSRKPIHPYEMCSSSPRATSFPLFEKVFCGLRWFSLRGLRGVSGCLGCWGVQLDRSPSGARRTGVDGVSLGGESGVCLGGLLGLFNDRGMPKPALYERPIFCCSLRASLSSSCSFRHDGEVETRVQGPLATCRTRPIART